LKRLDKYSVISGGFGQSESEENYAQPQLTRSGQIIKTSAFNQMKNDTANPATASRHSAA
jgi:hypothetical protein